MPQSIIVPRVNSRKLGSMVKPARQAVVVELPLAMFGTSTFAGEHLSEIASVEARALLSGLPLPSHPRARATRVPLFLARAGALRSGADARFHAPS